MALLCPRACYGPALMPIVVTDDLLGFISFLEAALPTKAWYNMMDNTILIPMSMRIKELYSKDPYVQKAPLSPSLVQCYCHWENRNL